MEDTAAYGMALIVLLGAVVLVGYCEIQTGLIDQLVDEQTEVSLARIEKAQGQLVDRVALRQVMDDARKQGEFMKMLRRLGAVVVTPVTMLGSYLLIASVLYAAVALSGRKPEYHTLMSICVYSGFVELAAVVLRFLMELYYRDIHVETSLAVAAPPGKWLFLTAVDPFRIWFWVLVVLGLVVTRQLSRRAAIAACASMFLLASLARVGFAYAMQGGPGGGV